MSGLLFILILFVLVLVHELGHFLAAKWFRVRVEEFGIGFPPRAYSFGTWWGTTYTLNWIPFGGFVRIFGESKDTVSREDVRDAFAYKSLPAKLIILSAGVMANMLLAWGLMSYAVAHGAPVKIDENGPLAEAARVTIAQVQPHSPAELADLRAGDIVLHVESAKDSLSAYTPSGVTSFVKSHNGKEITFRILRDGVETAVTVIPTQGVLSNRADTPAIGVSLGFVLTEKVSLTQTIIPGFVHTMQIFFSIFDSVIGLIVSAFSFNADISSISGPVGIAVYASQWSQMGMVYLLYFTAVISINLAVINLIPIPAFDGGRMMLVVVESLRKRPLSRIVTQSINGVGFALIALLMVVVTWSDIVKML